MDTELILIVGDPVARAKTVSDRFPHLNQTEIAWVADNFDIIATSPVFEYDTGGNALKVVTHFRKVHLPEPLRIDGTLLSIPRDDPGRVNIIYSIDYLPTVMVGVPLLPALRNMVRMASVSDPDFLSRRRTERVVEVLSSPGPQPSM